MGTSHRRNSPLSLLHELDKFINSYPSNSENSRGSLADWEPSVDLKETKEAYLVIADLPGVKPEDIDINIEDHILTLKGSRQETKDESNESSHRIERIKGTFFRQFTLPSGTVDAEGIKARSRHGVLELTIPKLKETKLNKIKVEVED